MNLRHRIQIGDNLVWKSEVFLNKLFTSTFKILRSFSRIRKFESLSKLLIYSQQIMSKFFSCFLQMFMMHLCSIKQNLGRHFMFYVYLQTAKKPKQKITRKAHSLESWHSLQKYYLSLRWNDRKPTKCMKDFIGSISDRRKFLVNK